MQHIFCYWVVRVNSQLNLPRIAFSNLFHLVIYFDETKMTESHLFSKTLVLLLDLCVHPDEFLASVTFPNKYMENNLSFVIYMKM